ncbi:MAG: type II toxin-antitoxin system Phd/YefM family antitoxin [Selenomonadaceae bacterium]|nr:type II toxin-antitoxin system Phd/YefM family antitoxin [Selenomonadaceae bacterium]MBR4696607.1 type II toxin-antitoxin system Phd/YefM family antitoxin [Selenomonadaceae bacterium]
MEVVPSGNFLEEFTIIADRAHEEKERFIIQRKNGRNVVLLSMDDFNEMQRRIYEAQRQEG